MRLEKCPIADDVEPSARVEIIAEFLSFLILPLFMIAILLAVIVYEKRAKSDRYPREK